MSEYDVTYAGETARSHDIYIVQRPDIPAPEINRDQIDIPGRDGRLYLSQRTVNDIQISIELYDHSKSVGRKIQGSKGMAFERAKWSPENER